MREEASEAPKPPVYTAEDLATLIHQRTSLGHLLFDQDVDKLVFVGIGVVKALGRLQT